MAKAEKQAKIKKVSSGAKKHISIDYPKNNEVIGGRHYAVRISALPCENVELCIDETFWVPCSNSAGHWWFHLGGLAAGNHCIAVRAAVAGATVVAKRKFKVEPAA